MPGPDAPTRPATEARFPGRCGACDLDYEEGTRIVLVDDEWVHEACAEDAE